MRQWLQATFWLVSIEPVEEELVELGTDTVDLARSYTIGTFVRRGRRVRYRYSYQSDN